MGKKCNVILATRTVVDGSLIPLLSLVKREDVTPMEVTSNLQSSGVFKVKLLSYMLLS